MTYDRTDDYEQDWSELDAMIDEKYGRTPPKPPRADAGGDPSGQPRVLAYNADFVGSAPKRRAFPAQPDPAQPTYDSGEDYDDADAYGYAASAPYADEDEFIPDYACESTKEAAPPRGKRRKKRHILRNLLLALLAVLVLGAAAVLLLQKQPKTDEPIAARKSGCSTVLLVGTDESGSNTDTLMLLLIDRKSGKINLLSIPRDTYVVSPFTGSGCKINSVYAMNGGGEEGMDALMAYVACCTGYRPDGYVLVKLTLFREMVDLMGGIEYDVPCDMYYSDPAQDLYIDLKAGKQKLNAEQAMGLVRMRHCYTTQDLGRVETQRGFIQAAVRQWVSVLKAYKLPSALRLMRKFSTTDLSTRNFLWLAVSLLKCGTRDMASYTLPGAWDGRYYRIDTQQAAAILDEYFNPYQTAIRAGDLRVNG